MAHRSNRGADGPRAAGPQPAPLSETQRPRPYGFKRVSTAYGLSLLAAILGLPGLAGGMISSNTCQIQGFGCSERLVYGIIVGALLALIIQLVMALHIRLGPGFWLCSTAIVVVSTALGVAASPVMVAGALIAPGLAAWISEPPNRRNNVLAHWLPRLAALAVTYGALLLTAVWIG